MITLSVVSHDQGDLVRTLLQDLETCCRRQPLFVIVTLNRPERVSFPPDHFSYPLLILENARPQGFGANHNQAFKRARGEFFGVLNPDLRLPEDPFSSLCALLSGAPRIGVTAPLVRDDAGNLADNARLFPTPRRLLRRLLIRRPSLDYPPRPEPYPVDWLAGLFLFFPRSVFSRINGFDERYFLYYEDVDLCARLRLAGLEAVLHPQVAVIHQARRHSHRKPRYLARHLASTIRFFNSDVYRRLRQPAP